MIHAVIMAGGSGTRFWPVSRNHNPKQMLSLFGERTMIQATVDRLSGMSAKEDILIVTNQRLVNDIRTQLPELPESSVIGEPCKRDTAPCIGLAARMIVEKDPDGIMVVMPADHVIQPDSAFQSAIEHAVEVVKNSEDQKGIVTFGIKPTFPAEIYGYVERTGDNIAEANQPATFCVENFREKPDALTAEKFVQSGNFYWNSGIFIWKAQTILDALEKYEPTMHGHIETIGKAIGTDQFASVLDKEFHAIEGTSIDYAVMENYTPIFVVEAPYEWDDVGNWPAIARLRGSDDSGNTIAGKNLNIDSKNCIVYGSDDHLVVTVGLEDCIVVHTPDATFVAHKDSENKIKEVVQELANRDWEEYL